MKQNADHGRLALLLTVPTITPILPHALILHIHILLTLPAPTPTPPTPTAPIHLILPAPTI